MPLSARPSVEEIAAYKPGKLIMGAIKLSSNEKPLGPSPLAVSAVLESLKTEELKFSIYPWERNAEALREATAEYAAVAAEKIVIGAGIAKARGEAQGQEKQTEG